jgi:hypothetical protein
MKLHPWKIVSVSLAPSLISLGGGLVISQMLWETPAAIAAPRSWKPRYKAPNRGAPGTNGSGASRPGCPVAAQPFVVFAPTVSHWGETIDARPNFWIYQPYAGVSIQLELQDEETQTIVFSQTYASPAGKGMVQLALPTTAPELKVDQPYRWRVNFICNTQAQQSYLSEGTIVRRKLDHALKCRILMATPENRITMLAEQGLWFNALHELARLRQQNPRDRVLLETWQEFLQHEDVQLGNWSTAKFLK